MLNETTTLEPGSPVRVAQVLLLAPSKAVGPLSYAVPDHLASSLKPGHRVLVPLRSHKLTGIVLGFEDSAPLNLKPIADLLDSSPILDGAHIELLRFISRYYLASLTEVCRAIIPAALRVETRNVYKLVRAPNALESAALSRAEHQILAALSKRPLTSSRLEQMTDRTRGALVKLEALGLIARVASKRGAHRPSLPHSVRLVATDVQRAIRGVHQRRVLDIFLHAAGHKMATAEFAAASPQEKNAIRTLIKRGVLESVEREPVLSASGFDPGSPFELNADQREAIAAVTPAIEHGRPQTFLLWGVTGSGKTEVYLRLAQRCVEQGRRALVLIPEIGLTEHLIGAFYARFGSRVAVLHSAQRSSERWAGWSALRDGKAEIAIGPRSAIFAPLSDLGLVIVDEEHDGSYKQEEGVRYNARDLAVALGSFSSCPVVLGSATPSAESYVNARRGRYRLISLTRRILDRPMPAVEVIDLRKKAAKASRPQPDSGARSGGEGLPLSAELLDALRENLAAGSQSIVFLNRRGYHNALQCRYCGSVMCCNACSVSLNFHLQDRSLRCHYCGEHRPAPQNCPECGAYGLEGQGYGTERIASALAELLPQARIERMDSDASRRRASRTRTLEALAAGEVDILVGTQMVAKGFDFPAVTLVGVVLADQTLNLPDFRSAERTFQLLTQVAGRAGRGERPGKVLIQTFVPHHYSIRAAKAQDYARFMRRELELRRELNYPPFAKLALMRFEGLDQTRIAKLAGETASAFSLSACTKDLQVTGPSPAPIERLKGRYRWQLMVRTRTAKSMHEALDEVRARVEAAAKRDNVRMILDIDPISML